MPDNSSRLIGGMWDYWPACRVCSNPLHEHWRGEPCLVARLIAGATEPEVYELFRLAEAKRQPEPEPWTWTGV